MHILIVHQYFLGADAPGGSRFNDFAQRWSEAGHRVTVVCGDLNYLTGEGDASTRWVRDTWQGPVRALRCRVPRSYARGYVGRSLSFAGFTASAMGALPKLDRPDVVIASSPPLVTAIPGWVFAKRFGCPWVFEVRDLWPESAVTTGVLSERGALTRALYRLEARACRSAAAVAVLTPAFRDDIVGRGLAPESKLWLVPNGVDVERFRPSPPDAELREELGWEGKTVFLYAGAHGRANALDQLVEAARRLKDRPDVVLATVGDGPERARLAERAARDALPITFHGARPLSEMPRWVNAADVSVAVLQDNPTFRTVYPNKVFDAMACARPLVLGIDGVIRDVVCADARAGVFARPEDPEALAAAILRLADDPQEREALGARGRAWVEAHADRSQVAARYLDLLGGVVRG